MRQVLMFLSLFALGGYALGNAVGYVYVEDWLPKATEKLWVSWRQGNDAGRIVFSP